MNRAYTIKPRQHLDAGGEVSRRAARAVRSGRGVRALHRGAQGVDRSARRSSRRRSTRLLTAEQRRKLPALVASYLDTRYLAGIRSGTAGSGGGGAFGGGFMGRRRWRRWRHRRRTVELTSGNVRHHPQLNARDSRILRARRQLRISACASHRPRLLRRRRPRSAPTASAQQPSERPPAPAARRRVATSDADRRRRGRAAAARRPSARQRSGAPARRAARLEHEADRRRRRHDARDAERVRRARRRLLPFRGDSTLFVDPASLSMLVARSGRRRSRASWPRLAPERRLLPPRRRARQSRLRREGTPRLSAP